MPAVYNASAPPGTRWGRANFTASTNERMYHSSAILLPDSSVLVCGSNPNADFSYAQWESRTDCERWYPAFYNAIRPNYTGIPENLSYGGSSFDLTMTTQMLEADAMNTKVVLIRGGFHTHAMGFGQRYLQLQNTYTVDMNSSITTLHVSQLPGSPGPTLFQPGPAMLFVVVDGVPSAARFVMIGSGQLGTQNTTANTVLPASQVKAVQNTTAATTNQKADTAATSSAAASGAAPAMIFGHSAIILSLATLFAGVFGSLFVLA